MVYYKPVLTTINVNQLAEILNKTSIKYHGLSDSIVTDRGSLFIPMFWFSLYYYLNVKHLVSTIFDTRKNKQTERQSSTMNMYLRVYCRFEQNNWVRWFVIADLQIITLGKQALWWAFLKHCLASIRKCLTKTIRTFDLISGHNQKSNHTISANENVEIESGRVTRATYTTL